jgi:hypothetical protein
VLDLSELICITTLIWMMYQRHLSVRLFNLGCIGASVDAEVLIQ